jgi:hypothetical protein
LATRFGDDFMMPRQLARGLQAKRQSRRREQRPLAECLPHINVNDLPIPREYQIYVAPHISLRYPHILSMRIAYDGVEFTHTGRTQIFDFKWIKTGFGYPRPAFICDCGRPVIKLYFRHLNLACRRCSNATYASRTLGKRTRPILQAQRLDMFLKLKTGMRKSTRQRLKARIATAPNQELKSKRLANHSIPIPHSNYSTRGAMHWR